MKDLSRPLVWINSLATLILAVSLLFFIFVIRQMGPFGISESDAVKASATASIVLYLTGFVLSLAGIFYSVKNRAKKQLWHYSGIPAGHNHHLCHYSGKVIIIPVIFEFSIFLR